MRALSLLLFVAAIAALGAAAWLYLAPPTEAAPAPRAHAQRPLLEVSGVDFPAPRRPAEATDTPPPVPPPKARQERQETQAPPPSPPTSPPAAVELPDVLVADFDGDALPPWLSERVATERGAGFGPGRGDRVTLGFSRLRLTATFPGRGGAVVSDPLPLVPGHCLEVALRARRHPGATGRTGAELVFLSEDEATRLADVVDARADGVDVHTVGGPAGAARDAARWDAWVGEIVVYAPGRGAITSRAAGRGLTHAARPASGPVRVALAATGGALGALFEVDRLQIAWVPCPAPVTEGAP